MIICGLTGGIGHGKTTFASYLAEQSKAPVHFETWQIVAEVAEGLQNQDRPLPAADDITAINRWLLPLADSVLQRTHIQVSANDLRLSDEKFAEHPEHYAKLVDYLLCARPDPQTAHQQINEGNKGFFRPLLQWLGGYLIIAGGSGIWYDEIIRRITRLRSTSTDLVTVGGVRYPGDAERLRNTGGVIIEIERPDVPAKDAADLTERERRLIEPDCIVSNNGTLDDLSACAKQVCEDVRLRQLQHSYIAQPLPAVQK